MFFTLFFLVISSVVDLYILMYMLFHMYLTPLVSAPSVSFFISFFPCGVVFFPYLPVFPMVLLYFFLFSSFFPFLLCLLFHPILPWKSLTSLLKLSFCFHRCRAAQLVLHWDVNRWVLGLIFPSSCIQPLVHRYLTGT